MKSAFKVLQATLAVVAVFIILGSGGIPQPEKTADRNVPLLMAFLVLISAMFLHWRLFQFVIAADLLPKKQRSELLEAGETGSQRGFFAGITVFGYGLIGLYAASVAGFSVPGPASNPLGCLFIGTLFLCFDLLARARGVVESIVKSSSSNPGIIQANTEPVKPQIPS